MSGKSWDSLDMQCPGMTVNFEITRNVQSNRKLQNSMFAPGFDAIILVYTRTTQYSLSTPVPARVGPASCGSPLDGSAWPLDYVATGHKIWVIVYRAAAACCLMIEIASNYTGLRLPRHSHVSVQNRVKYNCYADGSVRNASTNRQRWPMPRSTHKKRTETLASMLPMMKFTSTAPPKQRTSCCTKTVNIHPISELAVSSD